ncbi:MAG: acetyl-CoA carboxylase carboxyl transferase subunit alpha, partial [Bacillota bacterium]|nr:acetyl-CoA carboxylase carboxyl transferase subunit alpha [Bacillota bacterium]
ISPEGCASILWKDASKIKEACECLKMTAADLMSLGVIEKILPEKDGFNKLCAAIKKELLASFGEKLALSSDELLERRYQKFRKIGIASVSAS